jgi:hypothetical protein
MQLTEWAKVVKGADGREVLRTRNFGGGKEEELTAQLPEVEGIVVASGKSQAIHKVSGWRYGPELPWAIFEVVCQGVVSRHYTRTKDLLPRGTQHTGHFVYVPRTYRRGRTRSYGQLLEWKLGPKPDPEPEPEPERDGVKIHSRAIYIANELDCTSEEIEELFSDEEILNYKF